MNDGKTIIGIILDGVESAATASAKGAYDLSVNANLLHFPTVADVIGLDHAPHPSEGYAHAVSRGKAPDMALINSVRMGMHKAIIDEMEEIVGTNKQLNDVITKKNNELKSKDSQLNKVMQENRHLHKELQHAYESHSRAYAGKKLYKAAFASVSLFGLLVLVASLLSIHL